MRNIVIIIVIPLAVGGIAYFRMSTTEQEPASNQGTETPTEGATTPEEPPTEPPSSELEGGTVEIAEEPDSDYFPEEGEEEEEVPIKLPWSPDPEWWKKRQTPMFSNLATVMVTGVPYPTGEYTEERYLEIIDQMGVTVRARAPDLLRITAGETCRLIALTMGAKTISKQEIREYLLKTGDTEALSIFDAYLAGTEIEKQFNYWENFIKSRLSALERGKYL
jgi:hypothetical protein